MAVKQTTTENEEKYPISRILDFINEQQQRASIIQDYSKIAQRIVELLGMELRIYLTERCNDLGNFQDA